MDTLPLRPAILQDCRSQRPHLPRPGQSQTTIDLYLKPLAKTKQDQNDIRSYFPPVVKTNAPPNPALSNANSSTNVPMTPKPSLGRSGAANRLLPGQNTSLKSAVDGINPIREGGKSENRAPGVFMRPRNHQHVNSAVLPRFDPFFDNEEFPHSTSPMAPRVTDVVRHSLVPKPLNIKMPPPAAETSRSPSQTTSSPSSVEDFDTASFDGERREAPSFKQMYLSVHSRQHTNDRPVSSLAALRDSGLKPSRQRMDRPATLRSHTMPKLSEPYSTDSVIYFLPKISPTSDSSADEREPLMRTSYPKRMDRASISDISEAQKADVDLENPISRNVDRRKEALKDRTVAISPGRYSNSTLTIKVCR